MFATEHGMVKKTSMKLYDRTRRDGFIAINLKDDDKLISVRRVAEGEKVMMVSSLPVRPSCARGAKCALWVATPWAYVA